MSIGGALAVCTFASIGPLCRWFPEVKVMIWFGFFFMVLGRVVYIPWGSEPPVVYDADLKTELLNETAACQIFNKNITNFISANYNETEANFKFEREGNFTSIEMKQRYIDSQLRGCPNITEFVGCPSSQEWCKTTNGMTISQFILGFVLTSLGYPIGVTVIQTIYSKILGSRPQVCSKLNISCAQARFLQFFHVTIISHCFTGCMDGYADGLWLFI